MSAILGQYKLTIQDYKALGARMTGIETVLKEHIKQYGTAPMNADDLGHVFFTVKLALAAVSEGDYKKFGPNEFVDLLLYCETEEALDFYMNPQQLRDRVMGALEKGKNQLRQAGETEESIAEWASESRLYLCQPNFLRMLQAVIQKEVYEKLRQEKLVN
jgi:hypothetical protein